MARQLAMPTVVGWFENLSFDQQRDALGQMQGVHEHARSVKRAEVERQLTELGYAAPKKRGRPKGRDGARGNGRSGSVKAKYRDPKTGETWSGRGRMASWLKSKQDAGDKIEKYLV